MGNTPIYGFPYPDPSDLVANYPAMGQELAEDIEAVLPTLGGLTLIATSAPASQASVSINNCFSSTYQAYLIVCSISTNPQFTEFRCRLRAAGTDDTGSNYNVQNLIATGSSVSANRLTSQTSLIIGRNGSTTTRSLYTCSFINPAVAVPTTYQFTGTNSEANGYIDIEGGVHTQSTAYDGITFLTLGTNFSGNIRIYGYKNS